MTTMIWSNDGDTDPETMYLVHSLAGRLARYIEASGLTVSEASDRTGLSEDVVQLVNGGRLKSGDAGALIGALLRLGCGVTISVGEPFRHPKGFWVVDAVENI